jgi:dienelactone hydrolase
MNFDYTVKGKTYEGYLAMPSTGSVKAGVLIAHQYMGLIDYEKSRAEEMASMGYFAFALDVYGKGIRCNTSACAKTTMDKALSDLPGLRGLISAGTQQLLEQATAKFPSSSLKSKLVAMGYCFGGSMVLELARHPAKGASDGEQFVAVSSIHGTLSAYGDEQPADGEVVTMVQAHHAELDFQGDGALTALEAEMKVGMNGTGKLSQTPLLMH